MYKGWKKLTKAERKHLSESGVRYTDDLEKTFAHQKHLRSLGGSEPCGECRRIAQKLGYEI